ncbi:Helicase associated domain protein [Streptomyces sp. SID8385]|uniref:Helicase associated domain protein n=1 Tax=Streptomyces sp. SID8385 TaxID=2690364 RepID=UPI001F214A63
MPEQRERLEALGVRGAALPVAAATPAEPRPVLAAALNGPKEPVSKAEAAFQRGLTALEQWAETKGQQSVPRGAVVDVVVDGETVPVKLEVWLSNTKRRRDKLTAQQLAALAALDMKWASPAPAPEAASEPPATQPAPSAAPMKRAVREHHEECDK